MVARTIIACDNCATEPADSLMLDAGTGEYDIDLCVGCQATYGIDKLRLLLSEYGVKPGTPGMPKPRPGEVQPTLSSSPGWVCPTCHESRSNRGMVLRHMVSVHGEDMVRASVLVPPSNRATACKVCGFLASGGTGMRQHMDTIHPGHNAAPVVAKAAAK